MALALVLLALALGGCGDQAAIDQAKADKIRAETQQKIEAAEAAEARKEADWAVTRQASNLGKAVMAACLGVVVSVFVLGLALIVLSRGWQLSGVAVGYAQARAELNARLVHVDGNLVWPAIILSGAIHNLQTGEVLRLGQSKPPTPQLVTGDVVLRSLAVGSQAVQAIGKRAKSPLAADAIPGLAASIPLVTPPEPPGLNDKGAYRDTMIEDGHD